MACFKRVAQVSLSNQRHFLLLFVYNTKCLFISLKLKSLKETIKLYLIWSLAIVFSPAFLCVHFSPSSLAKNVPHWVSLNLNFLECFFLQICISLLSLPSGLYYQILPQSLYTIVLPSLHYIHQLWHICIWVFVCLLPSYFQCTHTLHELTGFVLVITIAPLSKTVSPLCRRHSN